MNNLTITGTVLNGTITTTRNSGVTDTIPINTTLAGYYTVVGELHTYNTPDRHLKIFIQPNTITETSDPEQDEITLTGYICKTPTYRITPGGKRIADILLAVNRNNNYSDYIPCISWGSEAEKAAELKIGAEITIKGRVQSRKYSKGTAYEVSINTINS